MIEQEWKFPQLWLATRDRLSERKLRLFGVGYCKFLRQDPYFRDFASFEPWAERVADGIIRLDDAFEEAWEKSTDGSDKGFRWLLTNQPNRDVTKLVMLLGTANWGEWAEQTLRCVAGHLLFPSAAISTSNTTAKQIAQKIYEERAFDRMPILADALEEAGCDNADILGHLRGGGEHVRGCWVIDLVLGKE
jgi:hypothetical protein